MSEGPRRLIDDPELGADLRAATAVRLSEARVEASGRAVRSRIAVLIALGASAAATSQAATWVKLGVGAVAVVTTTAVATLTVRHFDEKQHATPAPVVPKQPEPVPAPEVAAETVPEATTPLPERPRRVTPQKPPVVPNTSTGTAPTSAPPAPPPSEDLSTQLDVFARARTALREQHAAEALRLIDDLLAKHPTTALRPEAESLRAEALAETGRTAEAIAAAQALIEAPAHRQERGEWWRFIGDLEAKRGDCEAAARAYERALASPLGASSAEAARGGRERCAERSSP